MVSLFDRFKRPIIFYFEDSAAGSTQLGTLISVTIYCALLYLFFTSDMIFKSHPIITDQTLEAVSRPEIKIRSSLAIDVGNEEAVSFIDSSIFTIDVKETFYKTDPETKNGKTVMYENPKGTRPCGRDDFEPGEFEKIGFANKTCTVNKTISLRGYWDEPEVSVLTITLSRCDNATSEVVCKTDEEIDEFLYGKFFSIYLKNPQFDLSERENYEKNTWRNDFQTIDPNIVKRWNVYLKKVIFLDDQNWLFEGPSFAESYSFDLKETDMLLETRAKNVFIADIYTSQRVQKKTRIYKKLQGVLADTGGIASVLFIIGFLLTYPEFNLNATISIMSSLYDFSKNAWGGGEEEEAAPKKQPKSNDTFCDIPLSCRNVASERNQHDKNIASDMSARKNPARIRSVNQPTASKPLNNRNPAPSCEISPLDLERTNEPLKEREEISDKIFEPKKQKEIGASSSNARLRFNIWEFLKFSFKKHFKMKLNANEQQFNVVYSNFQGLLNICNILQRLYILELKTSLLFPPAQNKLIADSPKPPFFTKARMSRLKIFNVKRKGEEENRSELDIEMTKSVAELKRKLEESRH